VDDGSVAPGAGLGQFWVPVQRTSMLRRKQRMDAFARKRQEASEEKNSQQSMTPSRGPFRATSDYKKMMTIRPAPSPKSC
jgi:hypothetical protein